MGGCLSSPAEDGSDAKAASASSSQQYNTSSAKASREKSWKSTGIVALRDGNLRELPSSALALGAAVKTVDAANNRIATLPAEFASFISIQRLVLSQNRLTQIGPIAQLASLKILLLDGNCLTELPAGISALARLEKLSLSGNQLSALPDQIGTLKALKSLSAADNRLAALPPSLGDCAELEELDLKRNRICALPEALGRLARLRACLLDGNAPLGGVPGAVLRGCGALQTLSLHDCPLVTMEGLQATDGWGAFEERQRGKQGKRVAGGVLLGKSGLDDGLDHQTTKLFVPHA